MMNNNIKVLSNMQTGSTLRPWRHLVSILRRQVQTTDDADNLISNRNIKSEHASLRSASPPRERDSSPDWKVCMWHYALIVGRKETTAFYDGSILCLWSPSTAVTACASVCYQNVRRTESEELLPRKVFAAHSRSDQYTPRNGDDKTRPIA